MRKTIKQLGYLAVLLAIMVLICMAARPCHAELFHVELSGGNAFGQTDNGNFWTENMPTENILRTDTFAVGLSGDIAQGKYFGLLWSARYNHFGSARGSNNMVCAPDGCADGSVPASGWYRMNVKQKTSGYTFGLIAELKYRGIALQPEAGGYYGRTSIDSQLMTLDGAFLGNIVVKNHVTTYYYGGRLSYDAGWIKPFVGYRKYPKIGGLESFVHHIETYEAGVSIPVF